MAVDSARPAGLEPLPLARLIWTGLCATALLYLGLLFVLVQGGNRLDVPPSLARLPALFLGLSAAQTLAAAFLQYRVLTPGEEGVAHHAPGDAERRRALRAYVVCWALAESIASYGLVLGLVGRSRPPAVGFFVWAILLLVVLRPRAPLLAPPR